MNKETQVRLKNKDYSKSTRPMTQGWVCPKCGRVWAIWIDGCKPCNEIATYEQSRKIMKTATTGGYE